MSFFSAIITFIAIFLLILGVGLIIPGNLMEQYYGSGSLLSIPLYPKTANGICEYVGIVPDGNLFYPVSEPPNFNITFPLFQFNHLEKKQSLYLIHNLWGYNFNLSAVISSSSGFTKNINFPIFNRNTGNNRSLDTHIQDEFDQINEIIPSQFTFNTKSYFIYCPFSTLITKELNIEPECNTSFGAMASLRNIDYIQSIKIGEISFIPKVTRITFKFSNLTVNPMNYISTPVVFLATWQPTAAIRYKSAGIILIDSAIICYIIVVFCVLIRRRNIE